MKIKILYLIATLSFSIAFGQSFENLLYSKKDQATYLINGKIIANFEVMKEFGNDQLLKLKFGNLPKKGVDLYQDTYPNLSEYGLILFETSLKNIPVKSQTEIKEFLGADSKTKIYVDGYLLQNDYPIATHSIKEIEFITPDEQNLSEEKIVNV